MTTPNQEGQGGSTPPPKKWAGKYDTPEQLEEAYKGSAKVFQENQELKSKVESMTKVPDQYVPPEHVKLSDQRKAYLDRAAKKAGLNQDHYNKMAEELHADELAQSNQFEERKKAIGQEKINLIEDYVKKNYPEKLHKTMFNEIIKDDEAMTQAMSDRDKRLNSKVPGVDQAGAGFEPKYDGQAEVLKAREALRKNPSEANKKRYIDISRQVGEARFKK